MRSTRMKTSSRILWAIAGLILLSACMANQRLKNRYNAIEKNLVAGNMEQAKAAFKQNMASYSEEDKLLYELDQAIIAFYADEPSESNVFLAKADRILEENFTESISDLALSFVANDNVINYKGSDYENIYINMFKALNYIKKNDSERALVEVRRMNNKFKELQVRFDKEKEELKKKQQEGKKSDLGEFPFTGSPSGHYLSAIAYRGDDSPDDAAIDLRKMRELYENQKTLYGYEPTIVDDIRSEVPKDSALVNLIAFIGQGPMKYAWELQAISAGNTLTLTGSNPDFSHTFWLTELQDLNFKISIPRITERPTNITAVRVSVNGVDQGILHEYENFGRVAVNEFKSKELLITLKNAIRGIAKAIAAKELTKDMQKDKNDLAGNLFAAITRTAINSTEEADLRCWRLMPARFQAREFVLPYGEHQITLEYLDKVGDVLKTEEKTVSVNRNQLINVVTTYAF